jgi:hypothetical protein
VIDDDDMAFLRDEIEGLELSGSGWQDHQLPAGVASDGDDDDEASDPEENGAKTSPDDDPESPGQASTMPEFNLAALPSLLFLATRGVRVERVAGLTSPVLRSNLRVLIVEAGLDSVVQLLPTPGASWPALSVLALTGSGLDTVDPPPQQKQQQKQDGQQDGQRVAGAAADGPTSALANDNAAGGATDLNDGEDNDDVAAKFMTARRLPALVHLDLSWNSLPRLPDLSRLPSLVSVCLSHNEIAKLEGCHRMLGNVERLGRCPF